MRKGKKNHFPSYFLCRNVHANESLQIILAYTDGEKAAVKAYIHMCRYNKGTKGEITDINYLSF